MQQRCCRRRHRRSGAPPEGDVILCTSYLELEVEEGEEREGEEGELETEQKRDASMMKKEGREGGREEEWFPQTSRSNAFARCFAMFLDFSKIPHSKRTFTLHPGKSKLLLYHKKVFVPNSATIYRSDSISIYI